ncbi:Uncharacterised protein [Mycobacteroides abscessus subsp. abscessus]|nr:Uncharacterised protein [Mycobacteroides abscessus subsp. abscessus]
MAVARLAPMSLGNDADNAESAARPMPVKAVPNLAR